MKNQWEQYVDTVKYRFILQILILTDTFYGGYTDINIDSETSFSYGYFCSFCIISQQLFRN